MALLAPPQPVKLTATSPIISTDKSAHCIGRVSSFGVPRGDARVCEAWLEGVGSWCNRRAGAALSGATRQAREFNRMHGA